MSGSNTSAAVAFDNLRSALRQMLQGKTCSQSVVDAIEELEQHIEGIDEDKRHLKATLEWERLNRRQAKEAA